MNSYRTLATSSVTLGPEAYATIQQCIQAIAANQFGLHYSYSVDSPNEATVQFFWRPLSGADPVAVIDSVLENATVNSQDTPQWEAVSLRAELVTLSIPKDFKCFPTLVPKEN
jgi:hypothetical protein